MQLKRWLRLNGKIITCGVMLIVSPIKGLLKANSAANTGLERGQCSGRPLVLGSCLSMAYTGDKE